MEYYLKLFILFYLKFYIYIYNLFIYIGKLIILNNKYWNNNYIYRVGSVWFRFLGTGEFPVPGSVWFGFSGYNLKNGLVRFPVFNRFGFWFLTGSE